MTNKEYSDLAEQVLNKNDGCTKQSQQFYDEVFFRLTLLNHSNDVTLLYRTIDKVTSKAVMNLVEQGWVLNPPLGLEGHYEGVVVERVHRKKGLVKFNGEWHNLADLLSVGYNIVPF